MSMTRDEAERELFKRSIYVRAANSAADVILAKFRGQPCDSDGVDCCTRCNAVALARFAKKLADYAVELTMREDTNER